MMSPNEKNKLKLRQICFIFLAFMPVTKISLLPSVISGFCEEQLWLATAINFLLDIGVLLVILRLIKKHDNTPLFTLIEQNISKTFAKIVFFGYSVYFLLKALIPLLEQQDYVQNTLYEVTPAIIIFLPFFIVSFYTSLKGMKILGRCADLSVWITWLGLGLVLFLSITNGNYKNLLPIIQKPTYKLINGCFSTLPWYSDSVYMLLFMGHFYEEKNQGKKLVLSYSLGGAVIVLLMVIFYAVFGPIAKTRFLAIPELTIFSVAIANAARFDYVGIFLLLFSQVYAIILPIFLCTKCLERTFGFKSALYPAIITNGLLLLFVVLFSNKLFSVLEVVIGVFGSVFAIFGYVVPILLLLIPNKTTTKRSLYEKLKA